MVTGPTAFENFKQLRSHLLAVPKQEIAQPKAKGKKPRRP
jgi:hypothetical protein